MSTGCPLPEAVEAITVLRNEYRDAENHIAELEAENAKLRARLEASIECQARHEARNGELHDEIAVLRAERDAPVQVMRDGVTYYKPWHDVGPFDGARIAQMEICDRRQHFPIRTVRVIERRDGTCYWFIDVGIMHEAPTFELAKAAAFAEVCR